MSPLKDGFFAYSNLRWRGHCGREGWLLLCSLCATFSQCVHFTAETSNTHSSYNSVTSHKHLHNFYTHTAVFKLNYIIDDGFMAHILIALRIDLKHLKTCSTHQSQLADIITKFLHKITLFVSIASFTQYANHINIGLSRQGSCILQYSNFLSHFLLQSDHATQNFVQLALIVSGYYIVTTCY